MMCKYNVTGLTEPQLNWLVAKAEGFRYVCVFSAWKNKHGAYGDAQVMVGNRKHEIFDFSPSSNWAAGGPIIEREKITLTPAHLTGTVTFAECRGEMRGGPTALIAAMRSYAAATFGNMVDIPEELEENA